MKGDKLTTVLVVASIVATYVDHTTAKNLHSVQKNETFKEKIPLYEPFYTCGENCKPGDKQCPSNCLRDEALKDEDAFEKYLKDKPLDVRGLFCMVGCALTSSCPTSEAGEFSIRPSLVTLIKLNAILFDNNLLVDYISCSY